MTMRRGLISLGLLGLAACGGGLPPLPMPTGLAAVPAAAAGAWADSTRPDGYRDVRFRFTFQDDRGAVKGRGRARVAPPDSVRLDAVGPLGAGRTYALVTGDTAAWAEPEEDVRKLVPNYPLFWAMLGIARPPVPGQATRRYADSTVTAWQFSAPGDTVQYVREWGGRNRLIAEVTQDGKLVGRVETKFGPDGLPLSSRLVVPSRPARLDLTFYQNAKVAFFAPDTWTRPAPAQP